MYNAITHHSIFVLDQDDALDFYVDKLGLEVGVDVDLGFMRWLTLKVPGDSGREIVLETPGATGLAFILTTDDCRRTYDELRTRGVEFTQEPTEQSYGIDCALRDPFGNHIRISQVAPAT
jgi:predicted enzyme related to lactoylglutathione lyase